ncbi:group II intron reverse transcriptase/maturase [Sporomusa sphaeroides]|uniref:group II intron reverse transcriptase/maturase n=1 Tax=Sporomusa sphaeroides TaxID=47679 RepID=UPI002BE5A1B4|nr:group II intron reverse transcriptase/maturase [Sporomusa sphaeroides]HML35220.1 group II intron reverse transcriptase/maturase [Sporomusa sphaeroides]
MYTKLEGIAKVAKERPKEQFTALAHLVNKQMLMFCHAEMEMNKAAGIDKITKEQYELALNENLESLITRMKRQAYRPQPVRRVYIDKVGTNKKRPLGIPAYEDKLVQSAVSKIINSIYEQEFLDCSFGFRPNRGCHDALAALDKILERRPINYIVDADIRGFFDNVDHQWMMKFIRHRIKDTALNQLIARFLKAGVMEAGIRYDTPQGTPQGGVISPILANIYLHYVIDLWFEKKVRKQCRGAAYMVRYADDSVFCFENKDEAEQFYQMFIQRLKEFKLEVAEEKTKIIPFGKSADKDDNNRKSGTFDFLGFTHYYGKGRSGTKRVKRKTSKKKLKASISRFTAWAKQNMHEKLDILLGKLNRKLIGHYRYYGISDNITCLKKMRHVIKHVLYRCLNRRSQRKSYTWERYNNYLQHQPIAVPHVYVNIFKLRTDIGYIV